MIGRADKNGPQGDGVNEDVSFTLNTTDRHGVVYGISPYHSNCMKSDNPYSGIYEAETSRTLDALNCGYPGCNQGGMAVVQPTAYSIENHPADSRVDIDDSGKVQTLTSRIGTCGGNVPMVMEPVGTFQETGIGLWNESDCGATLRAMSGGDAMKANLVVAGVDCRNATEIPESNITLQSSCCHNLNSRNVVRVKHIVRRLTPLECERLQGFPDGWTDIGEWVDSNGKKHKEADSPRYKALGNSIAIPPWKWVLKRLCACYERDATMASLFDGIGGFPYIWEQLNGKGSCLWASEIEEFPMAVTKLRFGGETSYPGTGGGNAPMIQEPIAYNGANITSPVNVTNPQPGDPCHTLSVDSRNYVVLPVSKWIDSLGDFKCPVCGGVSEYATKHCPDCGEKMMLGGSDNG